MLSVGVQSGGIFNTDFEYGFKLLHDHGFECLDYNINNFISGDQIKTGEPNGFFAQSVEELYEYFKPMKEASEKYNVKIAQMHGPFPMYVTGREGDMNPFLIEATEKCMAVCNYVGCHNIVVHPVNLQLKSDKQTEIEINLAIYRALMPAAKKYGVCVCLENLFNSVRGRCIEGACSDISEAIYYIDTLNAEAGEELFGFCLDVGHANLFARNLREYIGKLGKRLKVLHVHDNDGRTDCHMLPYSYTQNNGKDLITDWSAFIAGLRDINYDNDICFETFRCMSAFPKAVHGELLDLIAAIGRHFVAEIKA